MINTPTSEQAPLATIGIIGLGVMGRNLLLNMADHGFAVAGYDREPTQVNSLAFDAKNRIQTQGDIQTFIDLKHFIRHLQKPRAIMLLVPAGTAVDAVISELLQLLDAEDIIIDAGNSHFKDSNRRSQTLAKQRIEFLSVGISGGEAGARLGPSIMPGGPQKVYEQVRPIFEAIAARVDDKPCVAWLGSGSAGHFVKMVHNGIEYAVMQLLAETYDFMKRAMSMNNSDLEQVYTQWNQGELNSYLVEITHNIFAQPDTQTNKQLIDQILDVAGQKGTGMWLSQCAMELQVPTPTIDIAVCMRDISKLADQRTKAQAIYTNALAPLMAEAQQEIIQQLGRALYSAVIITYAQAMSLLKVASLHYEYQLDCEVITQIWRGGCIIRSELLRDISAAYKAHPKLKNLLLEAKLSSKILEREEDLRRCIVTGIEYGIPLPAFTASLSYFDAYRSGLSPANLIQAQRDYFGAHTYERTDQKGFFHTQWAHN